MARRDRSFFFDNKAGKLQSKGKVIADFSNIDNTAQLKGSTAGNPVALNAVGDDTNIDLRLSAKGAGNIELLSTVELTTGKRIIDSAGTNVEFGDNIEMNSNKITGVGTPTASTDAATKGYVDGQVSTANDATITITASTGLTGSGAFTTDQSADETITLSIDSTVATLTGTQTLTNKTLTTPVISSITNTGTLTLPTSTGTVALTSDIPTAVSDLTNDSGFTTNTGTVTSVGGTGTVNGLTLSGTVTTSGSLTLGGTLGSITVSQLAGSALTTSAESFADNDTTLMTSAAINDRIESFGYTTNTGDITGVNITAGTGLSGTVNTTSGAHTQTLSIDSTVATLTGSQTLTNKTLTSPVIGTIVNTGTLTLPTSTGTVALTSDIPTAISELTNDSGYTTTSGTVTSVAMTVPTGLSVSGTPVTTSGTLAVSLASGYSIPTTTKQSQWDSAYTLTNALTATSTELNYVDGVTSAIQTQLDGKINTTGNNTITSTTAGSSAAPEFELFRDITGADANYIGQIKFSADNDANSKTVFAKITGKIGDASSGSEDGIIEIAHQKAGSQNINMRMSSTKYSILNGTDFDVNTHDGSTTGLQLGGTLVTATAAEINKLDGVTATTTELNYVDGVTSSIQTQLDAKAPKASPAFTGTATGVNLTLSGDLTVNGTTTTLATTNTVVSDALIELNNGATSNANDLGIVMERGSTGNNAFMGWDESADSFVLGTTTATGASTGDLTITAGALSIGSLTLGGTSVTATAAELNILDGVTATATELNLLDGVTATTTELNYVDGVTSAIQTQLDAKTSNTGTVTSVATGTGLTGGTITTSGTLALATAGAGAATYSSGISAITVDAYGRVTSVTGSAGFTTNTGDITQVNITAGTGLSGTVNTTSGAHTQTLSIDSTVATLTGTQTLTNKTLTSPVISSITNTGTLTLPTSTGTLALTSQIPTAVSELTNDSGFTTNTGDITGVTAGTGLSGGGTSGTVTLNLDFSELTDMTGDITGTTEFILQNGTTESRKAASEIKLSNFNNDSGFTTNTGTVTSVSGTGTVSGLTLSGTVTTSGSLTLGGTLSITESQISDFGTYLTSVALNDVSDVTITTPSSGQVLKYNGSAWVNSADSGGIALTDLSVTTASAGSAALAYNNSTGAFTFTPPDLSSYLTSYTVTQSDVTTHQAALSITESQISDLGTYLTASDITGKLNLSGGTMSGAIAMGTNKITGMGDPTAAQDAATKAYVDSQVSGGGGGNAFTTISVSGQSDVVADSSTDTLTLSNSGLVVITTTAGTDTIDIGTPSTAALPFTLADGSTSNIDLYTSGKINSVFTNLYVPFTLASGSAVTTMVVGGS